MATKLFLVDDDEGVLSTLENIFRRKNFIVRSFSSGSQLLTALESDSPDSILVDLQMPGLSGVELLKLLYEKHRHVPVFMMSGVGNIDKAVESVRCGALNFFEKPFSASEVVIKIKEGIQTYKDNHALLGYEQAGGLSGRNLLTAREQEVLILISCGNSSREAAQKLRISSRTVEAHRSRILAKLNAKNFVEVSQRIFSRQLN